MVLEVETAAPPSAQRAELVLRVMDTGVGIAEKDQARIFEEFTRGDDVQLGSGVGLGLSIVDRACRLLDHELSVLSTPGRGSVFRMNIAVVDGVPIRREPQSGLTDDGGTSCPFHTAAFHHHGLAVRFHIQLLHICGEEL